MTAYCGGNGTEVCNAYSKLIIFARLWSKTRKYPCIVLYFERSFAPLATMHAIRIFIPWIRLEVRTSNRVKINYVKTPLFPNFESLEPSFDGLDTRLKHLETRFEPRSSNLLGSEYRGSRSRFEIEVRDRGSRPRFEIEVRDRGSRDCQLTFERYCITLLSFG